MMRTPAWLWLLPGALWLAVGSPAAGQTAAPELIVRHGHYFVIVGEGQTAPTLSATSKQYFTYPDGLSLTVTDTDAQTRAQKMVSVGASTRLPIPGPVSSLYLVMAQPGSNGVVFSCDRPWGVVAAGSYGLGTAGAAPRMYLYLPPECEQLTLEAHAPSPGEGGRVSLLRPDDTEAGFIDGEVDQIERVPITVLRELRGQVWSLTWGKPQTIKTAVLDDVQTWLRGYLAPLVWPRAEWAATYGPLIWQRHKAVLDAEGGG